MRTVELHYDEEKLAEVPTMQLQQAIGRLSIWAYSGYPRVRICNDGKNDLIAFYTDANDVSSRFTIGAVWRPESKEYTFHS
jgi:hypothetical protein